jgi:hypothetical protein
LKDVVVIADHDEILHPHVAHRLRSCYPFGAATPEQAAMINNASASKDARAASTLHAMIVLEATHFEFGLHCRRRRPWEFGPHAFAASYLLTHFWSARQSEADGPVAREHSQSTLWNRLRLLSGVGHPTWTSSAWHLSSFGSAPQIRRKFEAWAHANRFLSVHEQVARRRQAEARESPLTATSSRSSQATESTAPNPTSSFVPNGFEHGALDGARLERCAALCLDPYPQQLMRPHAHRLAVPPCTHGLDTAALATLRAALKNEGREITPHRMAEGPHAVENGTEKRIGLRQSTLPSSPQPPALFYAPRYRAILFRFDARLERCARAVYEDRWSDVAAAACL